jgi:monofunctional biosynthetic peptidoglycan transglycosylase
VARAKGGGKKNGGKKPILNPRSATAKKDVKVAKPVRKSTILRRIVFWLASAILLFYGFVALSLLGLRWIDPPFTAVQIERRIQSLIDHTPYQKHYTFVDLDHISPNLAHAAIAAEDARFYQHHGFDWKEIEIAVQEDRKEGRARGASTITQQLVRNLFLSTGRSIIRKGIEFSIVPLMEGILNKQRILELYVNVIEWGPGVYGAEAASRYYYGRSAQALTRQQAADLVSILPAPLHRKPGRVPTYTVRILQRMGQMGW